VGGVSAGLNCNWNRNRYREGTESAEDREEPLKAVYHPSDSLLQDRDIEIEEQPQTVTREPKVGEQLGGVNEMQALNSLYLDNQASPDNEIESVPAVDPSPLE
jgi:hypothetical protein